ncbi:MAG: type II secretion system F family protein [Lachnospiraceae bacterium]|nr:type II secretion system F family protein [Lachnospiraceae bacterium]
MILDYKKYKYSSKDILINALMWIAISGLIAYFFYRSLLIFIILLLFFPLFIKFRRAGYVFKRQWELMLEFQDFLSAVQVGIYSGNSIENAVLGSYEDMVSLYTKDGYMTKEIRSIITGLNNNLTLEELFYDLGERSGVEEIMDFAAILALAKRSGGNLREIISECNNCIEEKIDIKRDIDVMIAGERLQHRIMCIVPMGIILYIQITSPGYLDSLYHNLFGYAVMTGCLLLYIISILWSEKIISSLGK